MTKRDSGISTVLALAAMLCVATGFWPGQADAQMCSPVQCSTTVASGMNCTVMATLPACPNTASLTSLMTSIVNSTSAQCLVGATDDLQATAVHPVGYGPNSGTMAKCDVFFIRFCTMDNPVTRACVIDAISDGLPVELMDFSVDERGSELHQKSGGPSFRHELP